MEWGHWVSQGQGWEPHTLRHLDSESSAQSPLAASNNQTTSSLSSRQGKHFRAHRRTEPGPPKKKKKKLATFLLGRDVHLLSAAPLTAPVCWILSLVRCSGTSRVDLGGPPLRSPLRQTGDEAGHLVSIMPRTCLVSWFIFQLQVSCSHFC